MAPPLTDHANLGRPDREEIQRTVEDHHGLDDVFAWGRAQPAPHEILQKRVQGGWMPTPSQTVDGDVVEGYAACMFRPAVPRP